MASARHLPASSSSTLSPHAAPFTVDYRRPLPTYDYPYSVRAEQFYPQSEGAPWNGPVDEGRKGGASSSSSAWSDGEGWTIASSAPMRGGASNSFSNKNIWCQNEFDAYGSKYFESNHQGWLQGKLCAQTRGSVPNPVNSSGIVFSAPDLADASFDHLPCPVSEGLFDTLTSASCSYFGSSLQNGSYIPEETGLDSITTYNPPGSASHTVNNGKTFVENGPKMEKPCFKRVDSCEKHSQNRQHVSVTIREPDKNTNVEAIDNLSLNDVRNAIVTDDISVHSEKQSLPCIHGLCSEGDRPVLHAKSELTIMSSGTNSSFEHGNSDQNVDMVDQLNLAIDSPCWKGAFASRKTPFHGVDNLSSNSQTLEKKLDEEHGITLEETATKVTLSDPFLDSIAEQKDVSFSADSRGGLLAPGCHSAPLGGKTTSSLAAIFPFQNEITPLESIPKPAMMNESSHSCAPRRWESLPGKIPHIWTPVGNPESCGPSDTSTKFEDRHFLFRALHDLSAFCLSYCSNENLLSGSDYELLSMTKINIETCLSKMSIIKAKGGRQDSPQDEASHIKGNDLSFKCNDSWISKIPKGVEFSYSTFHEHGGLPFPDANMDMTEKSVMMDLEKFLARKFKDEKEDNQSIPYKKLWIEAEANLCRMKYEFHCARAKTLQNSIQEKSTQDKMDVVALDNFSGAELDPAKLRTNPSPTSQPSLTMENDSQSIGMKETRTLVDHNPEKSAITSKYQNPQFETPNTNPTEVDADSSVLARFKILNSRASMVDSAKCAPPDNSHNSGVINPNVNSKPFCLDPPSCSDGGLDAGMCFLPNVQPNSSRTAAKTLLANAGMVDKCHGERVHGSYNSLLAGSHLRHGPLYEGAGGCSRVPGLHENFGDDRLLIESYIPKYGWHMKNLQDGNQGSSLPDWEHVEEENVLGSSSFSPV